MHSEPPLFLMGDIHGYLDYLVRHLGRAGLATSRGEWTGGGAQLWFMGDFTDRGPDGPGVVDFVMRLQADAARQGGRVGALLGNHDAAILSAKLFSNAPTNGPRGTFYEDWVAYGGTVSDLRGLTSQHIDWLKNLPAGAVVGDRLLLHADATFYLAYGETLEQVNAAVAELLHSSDTEAWDTLLSYAGERLAFDDRRAGGVMRAVQLLACLGGKQIVHGHTPIPTLSGEPIERVKSAFSYCENLVVDVDGGIYKGGAGFVYQAPPLARTVPA